MLSSPQKSWSILKFLTVCITNLYGDDDRPIENNKQLGLRFAIDGNQLFARRGPTGRNWPVETYTVEEGRGM